MFLSFAVVVMLLGVKVEDVLVANPANKRQTIEKMSHSTVDVAAQVVL